jgi:hypothetical protein|uniref:Uncharacterized protein n=1 Tax=viral metagenome TaxID=1070528 RepID=A0A6C0AIK5_9ZZZZ
MDSNHNALWSSPTYEASNDQYGNTYTELQGTDSAGYYAITSTMQDIYLKTASVKLKDQSCPTGTPQFIDPTLFGNYDQGEDYSSDGTNQCALSVPPPQEPDAYKQQNQTMLQEGKKYIEKYNALSVQGVQQQNVKATQEMKTKTGAYTKVLGQIKQMKPSTTLGQQQTDMEIFDRQNQTQAILWGVLATIILAMILL